MLAGPVYKASQNPASSASCPSGDSLVRYLADSRKVSSALLPRSSAGVPQEFRKECHTEFFEEFFELHEEFRRNPSEARSAWLRRTSRATLCHSIGCQACIFDTRLRVTLGATSWSAQYQSDSIRCFRDFGQCFVTAAPAAHDVLWNIELSIHMHAQLYPAFGTHVPTYLLVTSGILPPGSPSRGNCCGEVQATVCVR